MNSEQIPIQQISTEYIAIDPDFCGGKPRIIGTIMPVATIAKMYLEMGESLEEIASEYHLSKPAVYAAMAYYYDHREEIDRHTAESAAFVEQMKRNSPPSPLESRLRAIRGE
ncbi:DUF433 domain-containing protein [Moorena sp. SIO1F2]|uniref:DUF433 domain-containing protein n=1 Tax=Moorena sp. SIO1F2 TaxID=2607819 RepID=UPI0025CF54E6|nr:DUF433 domain-containing protein [Moorena sp. SIO1F2]